MLLKSRDQACRNYLRRIGRFYGTQPGVDYSGHATIDIIHPHEAKAQEDSLMATDWFTRKEVSTWPKLYDCLEKYLEEKKAQ
jgi:hypothetical protein